MPEITLFIDSAQGKNVSTNGSSFDYILQPSLSLPYDCNPTLKVLEANMFYTSPNLSSAKNNNTLRFAQITSGTIALGNASFDEYSIVFEDGLYSLEDIRSEIISFCEEHNLNDSAMDCVGLGPTQKVEIRWKTQNTGYGIILYLGGSNSIGKLLGFNEIDVYYDAHAYATPKEEAHFRSDNSANFDAVSIFLLHSSCLSGLNYDASASAGGQVCAALTPNVAPGSLIVYTPQIPLPCQADSLRGNRTSTIRFNVTDGSGNEVVLKESWNARILISW